MELSMTTTFPDVSISTERLVLRPFEPSDIPAHIEMMNDEMVTAWTSVPHPYTPEDAERWVHTIAPAERTGGRAFFPRKQEDLTAAFAEIEQELRSQYLVAYSPTNKTRDGKFRQMSIEITNPELRKEQLKLRYRPGYFAKRAGQ